MEVFQETDSDAPDTWVGGVPVYRCPFDDAPLHFECYVVHSRPMDLIEHMQNRPHRDVDHGQHTPGDVDHGQHLPVDVDHGRESA